MQRLLPPARGREGAVRWWTAAVGCIMGVLVLLAVIVCVPQLAIDPGGLSRTDWMRAVQDLRTSILQGLGGLAVLAGAVIAALTLRENSRQNRAVLELQRRGQTTERFTRAIEQLGHQGPDKLDVRIGAVYALEQIARDSAELHWPIMEVLTAYLREHAPVRALPDDLRPECPPADHQAIATVIGRRRRLRDPDGERLDLHATDLTGVDWVKAHLERARLEGAHLKGARFNWAHLEGADLSEARLDGARLEGIHLEGALLGWAHMEDALLCGAQLEGAWLGSAHLEGAWLPEAQLARADLRGTHLERAVLHEARGLTPEQLRAAADPECAYLSPEQAAWLGLDPAAEAPGAPESKGGPEVSEGVDPDRQ